MTTEQAAASDDDIANKELLVAYIAVDELLRYVIRFWLEEHVFDTPDLLAVLRPDRLGSEIARTLVERILPNQMHER